MSDILIKGMEMPKEGNWRSLRIYPDGTIGRPIGFGDYALVEGAKAIPILAVDARPVVLCRDCKHNMANIPDIQDGMNINENWNACQLTELYDSVKPNDFCSHGVKREENK